ncbi:MAG: hypothetical protein U1E52_13665 [Geminicoccaceae bacterium]
MTSWFTERTHRPVITPRPWLPSRLAAGGEADSAVPMAPALCFDEVDLARMAGGLVERGRREARLAAAESPGARQAAAVAHAAEALATAVGRRATEEKDAVARLVTLAAAVAKALGPTARDSAGLAMLAEAMLAGLDAPTARLSGPSTTIECLRPVLADVQARAGFAGTLELEVDDRLVDGALRLAWPDGWLERDPAEVEQQVAALLDSLRTSGRPHVDMQQGGFDDEP